jgi:hypothetical protein
LALEVIEKPNSRRSWSRIALWRQPKHDADFKAENAQTVLSKLVVHHPSRLLCFVLGSMLLDRGYGWTGAALVSAGVVLIRLNW